jgi:hypothetical protein
MAPSIINLNNAIPAAPAGFENVSWQGDTSAPIRNVSAYTKQFLAAAIFTLVGKPNATFVYPWLTFPYPVNFAANFAGSAGNVLTSPTSSTVTFTIKKVSAGVTTTVGTIVVASSGAVTFTSTGGLAISVVTGDYFTLTSPAQDATLAGLMFALFGVR